MTLTSDILESLGDVVEEVEFSAVGFVEVFSGEGFRSRSAGDDAHVQEDKVIEVAGDRGEVVVDAEDGFSLGVEVLQKFDDRLLGRGIDCGEGFVHEIDLGVLHESTGKENTLLLAAGELRNLAVGEVADADLLEGFACLLALCFADTLEPTELAVGAHDDDIEGAHRKIPINAFALRDVYDEVALVFVRLAVDEDLARSLWNQIEAGFE